MNNDVKADLFFMDSIAFMTVCSFYSDLIIGTEIIIIINSLYFYHLLPYAFQL